MYNIEKRYVGGLIGIKRNMDNGRIQLYNPGSLGHCSWQSTSYLKYCASSAELVIDRANLGVEGHLGQAVHPLGVFVCVCACGGRGGGSFLLIKQYSI